MTRHSSSHAVIIKIDHQPLVIKIQNLRSGEQLEFKAWPDLLSYLEALNELKGLR